MPSLLDRTARWLGAHLSKYLTQTSDKRGIAAPTDLAELAACVQPGDVLLVEGKTRISGAIKYLTQSTWSHAALFVGESTGLVDATGAPLVFVEADIREGVRAVPMNTYEGLHCRLCRPVGLSEADTRTVIAFVTSRLGHRYDMKNVFDLARYLFPTPPVPQRFRRRLIAFGSGDPSRAICSTLIAQAFQSVRYPILPTLEKRPSRDPAHAGAMREIWRVRDHSLFVPRDFDVSPYFQVIKPTLCAGFDYRSFELRDLFDKGTVPSSRGVSPSPAAGDQVPHKP